MRERSLEVAYLLGDKKLLQAQRQWEDAHTKTAIVLVGEMSVAMLEGRFADARKLVTRYQLLGGRVAEGDSLVRAIFCDTANKPRGSGCPSFTFPRRLAGY